MTCKQAEKDIKLFITGKLEGRELEHFMGHVDTCPECMEELSIQYLVSEGLLRLEDGSRFDFVNELNKKMETAREEIRSRKRITRFMFFVEGVTLAAVLVMTILVILK